MTFGEKLQDIRRSNNISQEALAEMLKVSRQSVSKWERGHGYPEIDKLIYICDVFNVSLDELLRGKQGGLAESIQNRQISDRHPISLVKEEDVKEIYPGNNTPALEIPASKKIGDYYNYTAYSHNSGSLVGMTKPKRRSLFYKGKLRKPTLSHIVCVGGGLFLAFTIICAASLLLSKKSHYEYFDTYYYSNTYAEAAPSYKVSYYTDSNGVYYILASDNGIADQIYNDELDQYIKITNIETGEENFLQGGYTDTDYGYFEIFTDADNKKTIFIPPYIPESTISADEIGNYTVMYSASDKMPYFIPNYVLPEELRDLYQSQSIPDSDTPEEDVQADDYAVQVEG